jgi:antirestriction protein ArdC
MRTYEVYNVEQFQGLPARFVPAPKRALGSLALHAAAEAFCAATGAVVIHGGTRAYYSPSLDEIHLPVPDEFHDADNYVSTKAHELIHWTKHEDRLRRDFSSRRFADTGYAREELVAELGAAFLCALLGISVTPREDHASYLGHWLAVLGQDARAIFSAAAYAQRAVDYLLSFQSSDSPVGATGSRGRRQTRPEKEAKT